MGNYPTMSAASRFSAHRFGFIFTMYCKFESEPSEFESLQASISGATSNKPTIRYLPSAKHRKRGRHRKYLPMCLEASKPNSKNLLLPLRLIMIIILSVTYNVFSGTAVREQTDCSSLYKRTAAVFSHAAAQTKQFQITQLKLSGFKSM